MQVSVGILGLQDQNLVEVLYGNAKCALVFVSEPRLKYVSA